MRIEEHGECVSAMAICRHLCVCVCVCVALSNMVVGNGIGTHVQNIDMCAGCTAAHMPTHPRLLLQKPRAALLRVCVCVCMV